MTKIVLLRHGESIWNKENLFTGWTDVDLSEQGKAEAQAGRRAAQGRGVHVRRRLHLGAQAGHPDALDGARRDGPDVDPGPALLAAQRAALRGAAGAEQGPDRGQVRRRAGAGLAAELRHPAAPARASPTRATRAPTPATQGLSKAELPLTECLKDTVARFLPYWHETIVPAIKAGKKVSSPPTATASGPWSSTSTTSRTQDIVGLNIPTGVPLVYELDDDLKPIKHYYLGDPEEVARAAAAVANQGKAK